MDRIPDLEVNKRLLKINPHHDIGEVLEAIANKHNISLDDLAILLIDNDLISVDNFSADAAILKLPPIIIGQANFLEFINSLFEETNIVAFPDLYSAIYQNWVWERRDYVSRYGDLSTLTIGRLKEAFDAEGRNLKDYSLGLTRKSKGRRLLEAIFNRVSIPQES